MSAIAQRRYTLEEYLEQDRPDVTHYVRQADEQWLRSDLQGVAAHLPLHALDCHISMAEIHHQVPFPLPGEGLEFVKPI